ncbi:MAG: hypothetical protein ACR2N7_08020 [Acidimicrobiia bacterium]
MLRPHIVIGSLSFVAVVLGTAAFLVDPTPIASSASWLIAFGLLTIAATSLSGLLLARAPWGRWALAFTVAAAMIAASIGSAGTTQFLVLVWATYGVGAAALVGLFGPWLTLWTRHHTLAEAPGPVVVSLLAVAPGAALYVGIAASAGAAWVHWLLVIVAASGSVLYGRGAPGALWILRVGVPLAAALAIPQTAAVGAVMIGIGAIGVSVLAWLPAAKRTTRVVVPPLPAPVPGKPRSEGASDAR